MEKEKLTREINELIIKICEYHGVLGNEQNAIYKYLKNCEKALMDLLNEFDKQGKKINNKIVFDNVFNYKSDYKTLNEDFKKLEELYEDLNNEFDKLEERYEDLDSDFYDLNKQNEKLNEKIEDLKERLNE